MNKEREVSVVYGKTLGLPTQELGAIGSTWAEKRRDLITFPKDLSITCWDGLRGARADAGETGSEVTELTPVRSRWLRRRWQQSGL